MKRIHLLFIFASLLVFSACEKVIYPDLSNGKTLVVIQGRISTDSAPWMVKLTYTQDYFSGAKPKTISGAVVTVSDNLGYLDTLYESSVDTLKGQYFTQKFNKCIPGNIYTLTAVVDGKTYTVAERCPFQKPIDSLTYEFRKKSGFIREGYYVTEHAQENEGPGDYYLWEIYRNDTLINDFGYFVNDDAFVNGNYIRASFPFPFQQNDSVRVDQFAITKQWYNYLIAAQTEASKSGSPFDSPPANPVSNVTGGAIGYFAVVNLQRAAIRLK